MVDTAVHDFTAKVALDDTDEFYLVQSPFTSGNDRKVALSDLRTSILNGPTLSFRSASTVRWVIDGSGHFLPNVDNTYDLGSSAAQARSVYAGTSLIIGGDVQYLRDAANVAAQRNGANAQTTRGYRTFTDASNYERWALQSGAGYFELAAETAGTGTDNIDLRLTPAGSGQVVINAPLNMHGAIVFTADNTFDLGNSGAALLRPRNIYAGSSIITGTDSVLTFDGGNGAKIYGLNSTTDVLVLWNNAQNNFGRLTFGGFSNAFPALKRSGTEIQVRLADDSNDAQITAGALRVNQAPTANTSAATTITNSADSASNLGHRASFNMNGVTYWFPCGATAF